MESSQVSQHSDPVRVPGGLTYSRGQLAAVARRYYLQDESKVQIAAELGISRFKVARMITAARDLGIVRIEVIDDSGIDTDLSLRLKARFDLRSCAVLSRRADAPPAAVRGDLALLAASELGEQIGTDDVLGLSWSRMVSRVVTALTELPAIPVVQLSGALTLTEIDSTVDVVRDAGRLAGAQVHHFYAPLVATDPDSAAMLRRQPSVAATLSRINEVSVAVVGVGAWAEHESTLYDLATPGERADLDRAGVVGEISGAFIDEDGHAIQAGMTQRVISVTAHQLRAIPNVIAVAMGVRRAGALAAAIRGGLVDSVVVDAELAEALMGLPTVGPRARASGVLSSRGTEL